MPKSRRNRVVHMTQVSKKGREQKDQLFSTIREQVPEFQHVFVLSVENMRNNHLKEVRRELSDSRYCRIAFTLILLREKTLTIPA